MEREAVVTSMMMVNVSSFCQLSRLWKKRCFDAIVFLLRLSKRRRG